ncbi:MAG: DUF1501 domain-containing protein [Planctomycetota bacterium]|nr:DUF1501 domain-containing protein [Planctomycetota bacterium]
MHVDPQMTSGVSRRQVLQAGGLGALTFGVPGMVAARGSVNPAGPASSTQKSCIFVLLCGGPSHLDTWDLKPNAPDEIRGPYRPIHSAVPGMQLSELHTRLSKLTDKFCLIRSMTLRTTSAITLTACTIA